MGRQHSWQRDLFAALMPSGSDGLVAFGWMWLKMAAAAKRGLDRGAGDAGFHHTKLDLANFYAKRELSGSTDSRNKAEAGAETVMRMPEMAF